MSYAFITSLQKNPQQSYVQLLNSIRNELDAGNYQQKPQLSCSHPISKWLGFLFDLIFCIATGRFQTEAGW